jgi:hypothetical protein
MRIIAIFDCSGLMPRMRDLKSMASAPASSASRSSSIASREAAPGMIDGSFLTTFG